MNTTSRMVVFMSPDVAKTIGRKTVDDARFAHVDMIGEPAYRSDLAIQRLQYKVPPELDSPVGAARWLAEGAGSMASSASTDVVVMSLHSELFPPRVWRHRQSGWLFGIPLDQSEAGDDGTDRWLVDECEEVPDLSIQDSLANISEIGHLLAQEHTVVVFNVSTYDPGDRQHRHRGAPETFAARAHRMTAGLEAMAGELGLIVIDVDGALAELGGADHVPAVGEFSDTAADFVLGDLVHGIDASGALAASLQAPVMRLSVPGLDRRTDQGKISHWYVKPGGEITSGSPLFDVRFDGIVHRMDRQVTERDRRKADKRAAKRREQIHQSITVSVLAGSDGHLYEVVSPAESRVRVGDVAAFVTPTPTDVPVDTAAAESEFRVGVRLVH